MKKLLPPLIITAFVVGFFTHALLFPDMFSKTPNFDSTKEKILGKQTNNMADSTLENPSLTTVKFKNGKFNPSKVYIKQGYYIAIRNDDPDNFMWLLSEKKEFTTVRNYGLSEEIKKRMDIKGTYIVYEKNTEAMLTIVVQ
jgi:hypothetical protein